MGGPEYSWLIYGWKVSRRSLTKFLVERKENNNWKYRDKEFTYYDEEDLVEVEKNKKFGEKYYNECLEKLDFKDAEWFVAKWFFPEYIEDVELNIDGFTIYIEENYNDHCNPSEMNAYISLIKKKGAYSLSEIVNLPNDLVEYGQKLATKLGSDKSEPSLISIIEINQ